MKKRTLVILSITAVLVLAVGGILAYLTDEASVTNTFTVGNVDITLDEADVDENGKWIDKDGNVTEDPEQVVRKEEGNEYHLVPGMTYIKDPTMTVKAKSEESYVRMMVTIDHLNELDAIFAPEKADLKSIFNGYDPATWVYVGEERNTADNTITYEFRYKETVKGSDKDQVLDALFDSITVPGFIKGDQLATIADMEIVVEGHAIQAAGFEADAIGGKSAVEVAWEAFDKEQ